jgi:hypothetical protein
MGYVQEDIREQLAQIDPSVTWFSIEVAAKLLGRISHDVLAVAMFAGLGTSVGPVLCLTREEVLALFTAFQKLDEAMKKHATSS